MLHWMKGLNWCSIFIVHGTEMIRGMYLCNTHIMDVHCAYVTLCRSHSNKNINRYDVEREIVNKRMVEWSKKLKRMLCICELRTLFVLFRRIKKNAKLYPKQKQSMDWYCELCDALYTIHTGYSDQIKSKRIANVWMLNVRMLERQFGTNE